MQKFFEKKSYKWEVLLLLWMAYLLNQGDRQVFNTVLPAIREALNLTDTSVGLIATIFNLFYAAMVLPEPWYTCLLLGALCLIAEVEERNPKLPTAVVAGLFSGLLLGMSQTARPVAAAALLLGLLLWVLLFAAEGITGYLEYLVQRHGDMYVEIYTGMIISSLCTGIFAYLCYRTGRKKETEVSEEKEEHKELRVRSDEDLFDVEEEDESEAGIRKRKKHGTVVSLILTIAAAVMAVVGFVTLLLSRKGKKS